MSFVGLFALILMELSKLRTVELNMCRMTVHCMTSSTCIKDSHKADHGKCLEFVILSSSVGLGDSVNLCSDAELVENYHQ